jgi:hypothetical protein
MPSGPLLIFDPRSTVQLQGFSGRAATTTIHDVTETGFQISGLAMTPDVVLSFGLELGRLAGIGRTGDGCVARLSKPLQIKRLPVSLSRKIPF